MQKDHKASRVLTVRSVTLKQAEVEGCCEKKGAGGCGSAGVLRGGVMQQISNSKQGEGGPPAAAVVTLLLIVLVNSTTGCKSSTSELLGSVLGVAGLLLLLLAVGRG